MHAYMHEYVTRYFESNASFWSLSYWVVLGRAKTGGWGEDWGRNLGKSRCLFRMFQVGN